MMLMQSLIYSSVYFLLLLVRICKSYQPYKHAGFDPRFRSFEPLIENTTEMVTNDKQVHSNAPNYKANYMPQSRQQHAEIARYRNEGNFYRAQPFDAGIRTAAAADDYNQIGHYLTPTSLFDHRVYHADTWSTEQPLYAYTYHQRRLDNQLLPAAQVNRNDDDDDEENANAQQLHQTLREDGVQQDQIYDDTNDAVRQDYQQRDSVDDDDDDEPLHEMRSFHDIYMRLAGPNKLNLFGHVEHGPHLFEQRFESQNKANRYKGEVLWADRTGGYGKQTWDLAQGKL